MTYLPGCLSHHFESRQGEGSRFFSAPYPQVGFVKWKNEVHQPKESTSIIQDRLRAAIKAQVPLCPASKNCAPLQSQRTYRCGFKHTNMDSIVESVVSRRTRQSYLQELGVLFCTYVCKQLISMVLVCAHT